MARTMLAAAVERFEDPLALREWDIPTPGVGQILIKTEACGVCHADLRAARGAWPIKPTLPFIPGHEVVGRVVAAGPGVRTVRAGDRVGAPWLYSVCGHCEFCLASWERACAGARLGGEARQGGFAEYVLAEAKYVALAPADLAAADIAPILCAGVAAYKGVKETRAKMGEWIAISGVGAQGHLAVQYAKILGLQICAIDIDDQRLERARRLGADILVNAQAGDPAAAVRKHTGGGAHGVLITAPSRVAFEQGVSMARKRGTCVMVGKPPGEFPLPLREVVSNCISVRGALIGTRHDMTEALTLAAEGKVKPDVERQPLTAINYVLGRLEGGAAPPLVVLDFDAAVSQA